MSGLEDVGLLDALEVTEGVKAVRIKHAVGGVK